MAREAIVGLRPYRASHVRPHWPLSFFLCKQIYNISNIARNMTQATLSFSTAKPESSQKPAHLANTFQDKLYFLYGTLMNPSTQALVLKHPGRPEHHSTYIAGHPINSGASTRPSWMRSQTRRFAGLSTESGRGSKKTGLRSMRWMFKG